MLSLRKTYTNSQNCVVFFTVRCLVYFVSAQCDVWLFVNTAVQNQKDE